MAIKSYNNLYEEYISEENILSAIADVVRRKKQGYEKLIEPLINRPDELVEATRQRVNCLNYRNTSVHSKMIIDGSSGKERHITVPSLLDQIVHHMVIQVLQPIFMRSMYEHTYASIPGRGQFSGAFYMRRWTQTGGANVKYCLKIDIHKFFDSIPHDILIQKLCYVIRDKDFMEIIAQILLAREDHVGLPIGFYTSQWFANWYLQGLDHYIKDVLAIPYYMRYMDDMVLFHSNKRALKRALHKISCYLNDLGLTLKPNYQIFRFHYIDRKGNECGRFLDFMGFRFYRNRMTLRKRIFRKTIRKAKVMSEKDRITIYDIRQMLSRLGWLSQTDNHTTYVKLIMPYINIEHLKKRVSEYDRKRSKLHTTQNQLHVHIE